MAYTQFDDTLPVGTRTGVQMPTDIRLNQQAMRDMIIIGGTIGWAMSITGADNAQPDSILYTKGLEIIRSTLTWGSSGGSDGNITQSVYEFSLDSGSNYDPIGTFALVYDVDGNVTSSGWT